MTDQEQYEKDRKDTLEVKWVAVLGLLFGLFLWGYMNLETRKLDKAVFEQASQNMADMRDDLRAIRELMDQHAFRNFGPERQ